MSAAARPHAKRGRNTRVAERELNRDREVAERERAANVLEDEPDGVRDRREVMFPMESWTVAPKSASAGQTKIPNSAPVAIANAAAPQPPRTPRSRMPARLGANLGRARGLER